MYVQRGEISAAQNSCQVTIRATKLPMMEFGTRAREYTRHRRQRAQTVEQRSESSDSLVAK